MNNTDASDYSPLAFGAGLALGLMLLVGLPRATNAPLTHRDRGAVRRAFDGEVGAQVAEMTAAHRALALADQYRREGQER